PALEGDDRLAAREPSRNTGELARVAEGFEVHGDHIGGGVLLPVLQQVVRRYVRLVAERREGGDADVVARGVVENREAQGAALRGHADAARHGRAGTEGRVETHVGRRVED